jgi:glycerol-3-phosphate acyltransferase PlsY
MMALVAALVGYVFGSIPFGLVLTRAAGLGDIRNIGSGNIGATNVLRTGRKDLALATLLLDGGKGAIAVLAVGALLPFPAGLIAGVAAVVGHNFPVWLKFKGGKGVATTLGTILAADFWVGVLACATWLIVAAFLRYSSLAALVALALAPAYALYFHQTEAAAAFAGLAVLGCYRHRANISRLLRGHEPKIGAKKT